MGFTLVEGDTVNPLIFATRGISSPFGSAPNVLMSLKRNERTPSGLLSEVESLLADCDDCHTKAQVRFPKITVVNELAVQWALISPKLFDLIKKIKKANEECRIADEDIRMTVSIYELLLTRRMTFLKNGIF